MPLPYSIYVRNIKKEYDKLYLISYIGKLGFEDTVFIEADSISEAEKLFDENFHKRKLIGVREYGIRALKKTAG